MTGPVGGKQGQRQRRLRKIWLLRQLHGVVLLAALLGLYKLAGNLGFDRVARGTLICLFIWPVFVAVIAWWDARWVRKHQDRLLGTPEAERQP